MRSAVAATGADTPAKNIYQPRKGTTAPLGNVLGFQAVRFRVSVNFADTRNLADLAQDFRVVLTDAAGAYHRRSLRLSTAVSGISITTSGGKPLFLTCSFHPRSILAENLNTKNRTSQEEGLAPAVRRLNLRADRFFRIQSRLRGGEARDGDAKGRTAHVIEANLVTKRDGLRIAAMLAADAEIGRASCRERV